MRARASERTKQAAKETTREIVGPRGGDRRSKRNLRFDTAAERAEKAGVSRRTQQKQDAIARKSPALLKQVQDGIAREMLADNAEKQAEKFSQGTRTDQLPYEIRKSSEKGRDGGTSAEYLLRRIARKSPDVLDRYKAGEFKSARKSTSNRWVSPPPSRRNVASHTAP